MAVGIEITVEVILGSKGLSYKRGTQRISVGVKASWVLVDIKWWEGEFSMGRGKVRGNIWRLEGVAMEVIDVIVVALFIKLNGTIVSWNAILLRKTVRGCWLLLICLF
jgi:hypothetical protein